MKYLHAAPALVCLSLLATTLSAQAVDSTRRIPEVLVTGIRETNKLQTSLNISALSKAGIAESGAHNLCEALTRLPGVSALSTGVAITKPVIRGLYGNRVLVLLSSLKFDNQQWQDEHGMGLSDVGIERVELIKGPASILYGSEAVGGVVNVLSERPAHKGRQADASLRFSSNTLGLNADAGFGNATDKGWWNVRLGAENHADYSDGGGARVLNSRFSGYYWKAAVTRKNARSQSINRYNGSFNNFGFVLEDLADFFDADSRWSRSMVGPHHTVLLNVLSSENTFYRTRSTWKVNAGLQSNLRLEDEGGGAISLNMHLVSLPYNVQWLHPVSERTELILSNIGSFENNTNFGSRIIVPDANMLEEGLSFFCKHHAGRFILEAGAGVNDKFIQAFETRGVNTPDKENRPFVRNRLAANGLAGITWNPNERWNLKINGSTGFRAPNLAELASDGLHEGIFQYEIGKPDLRNEQNLNTEAEINYSGAWLQVGTAFFHNQFYDYVYLAPTGRDTFGFPVYRYRQANARLYGGEASLALMPGGLSGWSLTEEFSTVKGLLSVGGRLPYIPAAKWTSRLRYERNFGKKVQKAYLTIGSQYIFKQNHPAVHETTTPAYFLLDAGLGANIVRGKQVVDIRITGSNLLDRKYADHLSRFKNYGLYNIGRNVMVSARFHII
jgi:iron complex outermembrane receptor protein